MQVDAKKIITEGDVDVLVNTAREVGTELARGKESEQLSTSQIRSIFGEVRRIQMNWTDEKPRSDEAAYRSIVLLQPKLAYQEKRKGAKRVDELRQVLDPCINEIRNAPPELRKPAFLNFVDFFEAILAYHKAAGGK